MINAKYQIKKENKNRKEKTQNKQTKKEMKKKHVLTMPDHCITYGDFIDINQTYIYR